MLSGKNNNGFDQLTTIYVKDRATRKDAQTATDIIEEINVEDVATTNTHEERNDFYGYKADVSLDDMDVSATQPQPTRNQEGLTEDERYRAQIIQCKCSFSLVYLLLCDWNGSKDFLLTI
ncbi:hypothetical protein Gotur_014227, partial [Gossypium turneri]